MKLNESVVLVNCVKAPSYGGGEKWYYLLAKAFKSRGYEVHLVSRKNSKLAEKCSQLGINLHDMKFGADFNPVTIVQFYQLFKKIKPEVVFVNFNKDVSTAGIAARLAKVNKVLYINGLTIINKQIKHKLLMPFYDVIIANNEQIKKHYQSYGWGLEKKVEVIYNGIELLDCDNEISEKKSGDEIVIFGAGRLVSGKRYNVFIDLISRLKRNGYPVKGIVAGDGPDRKLLQAQIEKNNAPVELVGHISSIKNHLGQADLFLHTSSHEGMPTVLIEAMSQNVLCIATDAGGTNELIKHDHNGYLHAIDDVDGLYTSLVEALEDKCKAEKLTINAKKTFLEMFDFEDSINKIEALFKQK